MMTMDKFAELLERIQAEENIVREAGQREYAHDAAFFTANGLISLGYGALAGAELLWR